METNKNKENKKDSSTTNNNKKIELPQRKGWMDLLTNLKIMSKTV